MNSYRIVDITNSSIRGVVRANTERGALIIAKRTIVNPNGFYAAYLVEETQAPKHVHTGFECGAL